MGYIRHHAIVITSVHDKDIKEAHSKAIQLFDHTTIAGHNLKVCVSSLSAAGINGTRSFCIFPDGSKEGWGDSDRGDIARAKMLDWLREQRYDDGSSSLSWVAVQYGDDDCHTEIVDDSEAELRKTRGIET